MEAINISRAQALNSPNPFALLTTRTPHDKINIMAISWWSFVANKPPMLIVALGQKSYSRECIETNGTFALCLPDKSLAEEAVYCGTVSGRNEDKAQKSGMELVELDSEFPKAVKNSHVVFLCRVENTMTVGDHIVFVASIQQIFANEEKTHLNAYNGYKILK